MSDQINYLPESVSESLKLKKFYVQLKSTNSMDDFSDLVLLTLDCNHEQIDIIHLSSSTPIKGPFIIYKDNVRSAITIWFDTTKIPKNIFHIKLDNLRGFDSIEIKLSIYNELVFKKIYEYFYTYKFMKNTLLKLKRNNDFFLYDNE